MNNENIKKKEPWRFVVGTIAVIWIIFMWIKKDIASVYASTPQEEVLPLIITTLAVSLIKVAVIAGGVLLIKWIIRKIRSN